MVTGNAAITSNVTLSRVNRWLTLYAGLRKTSA